MGEKTQIQWTDHTWNAWVGCVKVSAGCTNCYAEHAAPTRKARAEGRELWGPASTRMILSPDYWLQLGRWNRAAARSARGFALVFMSSLSDFFEDHPAVLDARAWALDIIATTPNLTYQILTKRPENIVPALLAVRAREALGYTSSPGIKMVDRWLGGDPPANVWLGTTTEDQKAFDLRWPILAAVPVRVAFISYEPAVGPLELGKGRPDWVIVGGESGNKARPFHVEWARDIVAECAAEAIPVFVKQMGAKPIDRNDAGFGGDPGDTWPDTPGGISLLEQYQGGEALVHLGHKKGGNIEEWPDDLRVRQFPIAGGAR